MAAAPKAKTDAGNADADAGSKKKKKLLLMIGVAVALIAISVGGTVVALKVLAPPPAPAPAGEAAAEEKEAESTLLPAIYYEMKPNFTINFNVNGRQRYLQAAITLLYRDPLLEEVLKLHMPAIRNGLVMLLSSKEFDELQTNEGKETLREEALEIIQSQLEQELDALSAKADAEKVPKGNVEQVLFTNFVMQ